MFDFLLFALGLLGGGLSGLLGIGGGIVMVPLLLYVPPALGFAPDPAPGWRGIPGIGPGIGLPAPAPGGWLATATALVVELAGR